jgi:ATP synthase protein I
MDPEAKRMWKLAGRYSAVGLEMGLAVVFGYAIGSYLDKWLGTEPYLTAFWTLAGVGAAFKAIYDAYRDAKRDTM